MAENRERIFKAFEDIPIVVEKAQTKVKIYPNDKQLRKCANSLYKTVMETIRELISSLLESSPSMSCLNFS